MGISPIAGIRSLPVTKITRVDGEVSRVFDIENSSRPDDDSYSGNNKKGAGGQSNEDAPPEDAALLSEEASGEGTEESTQAIENQASRDEASSAPSASVNYFA